MISLEQVKCKNTKKLKNENSNINDKIYYLLDILNFKNILTKLILRLSYHQKKRFMSEFSAFFGCFVR